MHGLFGGAIAGKIPEGRILFDMEAAPRADAPTRRARAGRFITQAQFPWQHVIFDFHGPITPGDTEGYTHVFIYLCVVCRGAFLIPSRGLRGSEVRRAIIIGICRALAFPELVGHDMGPDSFVFGDIWSRL